MLKIKLRYLADIEPLEKLSIGDWIDLRLAEDISLKKGEFRLLPLGIAMELPAGYEAIVAPRSSTFKKHKILMSNSIGVVDCSYRGDGDQWHFPALAAEDTFISKNTRICQFRILENQPEFEFEVVDSLGNEDRGGFGTTGL